MSIKPSRVVATVLLYGGLFCFGFVTVAATVNQRVTVPAEETTNNSNNENNNNGTDTNTPNTNNDSGNTNVNAPINTNANVGANINSNNNTNLDTNTPNTNTNTDNNNANENNEDTTPDQNNNTNANSNTASNSNLNIRIDDPEQPAGQIPSIGEIINNIQESATAFIEDHPTLKQTANFIQSGGGNILTTTAGVTGVISWTALAASQAAGVGVTVTSFADLSAIIVRFFAALFGLTRRKRQPWGTVYDAVTKRPLDPAYVLAQTPAGEEIKESFTDLDGRYGFLLPAGAYLVTAQKTHYAFPSKKLAGRSRDELYDNLYFGEQISARGDEIITRNIPLDPVDFDWNEFEKNQEHQFRFYSQRRKLFYTITLIVYIAGFGLSLAALLLQPGVINIISVSLYVIILLYHLFWLPKRRAVTVKYESGRPMPFGIIRFYSAKLKKEIKSVVTDAHGQFYVLLEPSRYYITVEAKLPDGSYKLVYRSDVMELKKGIMPHSVTIPTNWTEPPIAPPQSPTTQTSSVPVTLSAKKPTVTPPSPTTPPAPQK